MDGRWLLLAVGVLFGVLTAAFAVEGATVQATVAGVQTVAALGVFWWYWSRDEHLDVGLGPR